MRLSAICEALSKPLAQKVYQLHLRLETAYNELSGDQLYLSTNEFMSHIRSADVSSSMPHGDYILKVFQRSIEDMLRYVNDQTDDVDLDIDTVYQELAINCKEVLSNFVEVKKAIASNGLSVNINDYAPVPNKGIFDPINAAIQAGYQYRASTAGNDTLGLSGVKLVHTEENDENPDITYRAYLVTDPKSLAAIALGYAGGDPVGWCTKEQAKAKEYTDAYDNYVIFRNQQPTSQFSIVRSRAYNFGETEGSIAEHQDSQNNKERREQMIDIAKTVQKNWFLEKGEFLRARGLSAMSRATLDGLVNYMRDHNLGDNEEERQNTIIARMRTIKNYFDEMEDDIPLVRSIFGQVLPYSLGDFISCVVGAIELGVGRPADGGPPLVPLDTTDEQQIVEAYSNLYKVMADMIYEIEGTLEQIPEDTGERPMVLTDIGGEIDKIRKSAEGRVGLNTLRALNAISDIKKTTKSTVYEVLTRGTNDD